MKRFRIVMLLITASTAFWSCEETGHPFIEFANKSNRDIVIQHIINWSGGTTFRCLDDYVEMTLTSVRSDTICKIGSNSWSKGWEGKLGVRGILNILVADRETYMQYWEEPCDTIRKYVPILHHYRLTEEDLERMKWKVVYPLQE